MTQLSQEAQTMSFNNAVAAQIRAHLGRLDLTKHDLAVRMGENDVWIGRRLTRGVRIVPLGLDDLERIAEALRVPVLDLIPGLPRLDSNQQPAGSRTRHLHAVREVAA